MIRERLLALSDYDYSCTYSILESPMGVENYVATLKLTPVTDGARTFAEWSAEFDCAEGRERELTELIGDGVFQGGFDALKRHFGGAERPRRRCCRRSSAPPSSTRRSSASGRCCATSTATTSWHDVVDESRIEGGEAATRSAASAASR